MFGNSDQAYQPSLKLEQALNLAQTVTEILKHLPFYWAGMPPKILRRILKDSVVVTENLQKFYYF